jgi:hypothetical protein
MTPYAQNISVAGRELAFLAEVFPARPLPEAQLGPEAPGDESGERDE